MIIVLGLSCTGFQIYFTARHINRALPIDRQAPSEEVGMGIECQRCGQGEAIARAVSDVLDMAVCYECSLAGWEIPLSPLKLGHFIFRPLPEEGCANA